MARRQHEFIRVTEPFSLVSQMKTAGYRFVIFEGKSETVNEALSEHRSRIRNVDFWSPNDIDAAQAQEKAVES